MSVVKHIHFEKLRTVVESFKSLQYYTGVVDLALVYAAEQDTTESLNLVSRVYYAFVNPTSFLRVYHIKTTWIYIGQYLFSILL